MNHADKQQRGFTIIELMLAMTFVSFLLLGISLTIIQIGAIYNQGTTMKEINQASRDINDDIRRNIAAAGSLNLTTDFVYSPASATAATASGGRLCLGSYSYVWNYAKTISSGAAGITKYVNNTTTGADESLNPIRMIKVADPGKTYCAKNALRNLTYTSVSVADQLKTSELLKSGDHDLGIHSFVFNTPPASAVDAVTGQQLYSINYVIGTSKISAMNATQTACLPANVANADPLYCNVQPFSLVVRADR